MLNKGAAMTARNSGVYGVMERKIKGKSCWKEREGKGGKELSPGSLAHGLRNSITAFFSPHPDLSLNTAKRFPRTPVLASPVRPSKLTTPSTPFRSLGKGVASTPRPCSPPPPSIT